MTLAYWCVLIAALLPYLFTGFAKFGKLGSYDNRAPREFLGRLDGWRKRADWAQMNTFEAFPFFAAAVIIAHLAGGARQSVIDGLAVAWVVLRLLYGAAYILDKATLRSLLWTGALGCAVALFIVSA